MHLTDTISNLRVSCNLFFENKIAKSKFLLGVGKSTVAYLLSLALARCQSSKVGVVDLDICGPSIPKLFNVENQPIVQSPYGWKPLV